MEQYAKTIEVLLAWNVTAALVPDLYNISATGDHFLSVSIYDQNFLQLAVADPIPLPAPYMVAFSFVDLPFVFCLGQYMLI